MRKNKGWFEQKEKEIIDTLTTVGVDELQSRVVARCLITADLYGVETHGTMVLSGHIKRIKAGSYNLTP